MSIISSAVKSFIKRLAFGERLIAYMQQWYPKFLLTIQSREKIFTDIYETNYWNVEETVSGVGSTFAATETIRRELPGVLKEFKIQSMLDIPCGDFSWMKEIDLSGVHYIGADIVRKIVENNANRYAGEKREFLHLDIAHDALPQVDLIFVRDCFGHFSYNDVFRSIKNIVGSRSTYLLATTFTGKENSDILTGLWRPINLLKPPFNFPLPLALINEKYADQKFKDKSMALWKIDDIKETIHPK